MAYGLPFDEKNLVELPFESLAAKVLCINHNNALSKLDEEAGNITKTFLEIKKIFSQKTSNDYQKLITFSHSGYLLERWFLKIFINLQSLYAKNITPPKELIEIVFGLRNYPAGVGLAIFGHNGWDQHSFDQDMKYVQILNGSNQIEFVIFEYFGLNFLLPLTDQPMPKNVMNLGHNTEGYEPIDKYISKIQGAPTLVHPKGINFKLGDKKNIQINFSWGN